MIEALDPQSVVEHTLEGDAENPSVFLLRPLTARERMQVLGSMQAIAKGQDQASAFVVGAEAMEAALRRGLVGWRNFPAEWDANDVQKNLDRLPDAAYEALGLKVLALARLGPQEKKGSSSP